MQSPQHGYRRIKTVTTALVALALAGTLGGSALAFAGTHSSTAKTTAAVPQPAASNPDDSGPDGSGSAASGSSSRSATPRYGYGPAPRLSTGSGSPNVVSSGS